jgi:hypothetical protein
LVYCNKKEALLVVVCDRKARLTNLSDHREIKDYYASGQVKRVRFDEGEDFLEKY